jgi:hypothetical protein
MFLFATILLLLAGVALGVARRRWWEIGVLTVLASGSLRVVQLLTGGWRGDLGLPLDEPLFDPIAVGLLFLGVYVSYGLGLLFARWRLDG